jgi:hypothetical protein
MALIIYIPRRDEGNRRPPPLSLSSGSDDKRQKKHSAPTSDDDEATSSDDANAPRAKKARGKVAGYPIITDPMMPMTMAPSLFLGLSSSALDFGRRRVS